MDRLCLKLHFFGLFVMHKIVLCVYVYKIYLMQSFCRDCAGGGHKKQSQSQKQHIKTNVFVFLCYPLVEMRS